MKRNLLKTKNGITLIALVITIIVLLILAGVTIATLMGNNGILSKAQKASEDSIIGREKEAISLAFSDCKIENKGTTVESDKLEESLINNGENAFATGYGTITVTFDETNHRYTVNQNGNLIKLDDLTPEEANKIVDVIANGVIVTANGNVKFIGKIDSESEEIKNVEIDNPEIITTKGVKQLEDECFLDNAGSLYNLTSETPERITNVNGVDVTNKKIVKIYSTNPLIVADEDKYLYGEGIQGTILENKQIVDYEGSWYDTIVAIDTDGNMYVCGDNYYGQLGIGTTEDSDEYICLTKIEENPLYNKKIVQFFYDQLGNTMIVRDKEGKIYSWGHNYRGTLGNPDIEIDFAEWGSPKECYITEPVCISEQEGSALKGKNIVKLKESENSVYAIDAKGKVYTWGKGYHGILCDRQTENRSYPVCISNLPDHVFNKIKIIDVVTNYGVAIAIDDNGKLYTWGGGADFESSEETDILDPICLTETENSGVYGKKITHIDNYGESDYNELSVIDSDGNLYIKSSQLIYISEFDYNRNMADRKEINGEIVNEIFYFEYKSLGIHYYLTDNGNLYFSSEILGPR